jgi:hypothetical protein
MTLAEVADLYGVPLNVIESISPDSAISRPTISVRSSVSLRR